MTNIKAVLRNETTSSANNKLRKNGFIPDILYGVKDPNKKISINENALKNLINSESFLSKVFDFFNYNLKAKNYDDLVDVLKLEYGIMPTSQEFKNLEWAGFFSDKKFKIKGGNFSDFLLVILKDKWTLDDDRSSTLFY